MLRHEYSEANWSWKKLYGPFLLFGSAGLNPVMLAGRSISNREKVSLCGKQFQSSYTFCVAVGFAGKLPGAQLLPFGVDELWLFWPRAVWVAMPAQAGKIFSKKGTGWIKLTSVPTVPFGCTTAAALESMVAAWKYCILLVGSVRFVGMARSTCIGRRLPMLPT